MSAPARGDIVRLDAAPAAGHEQAGRRPALVISPQAYNERVGLMLCCPVTSRAKGYPFEVALPDGGPAHGVVLADQVRNLDWRARRSEVLGRAPASVVAAVLARVQALVGAEEP